MAANIPLLLRLPPCLRQQLLSGESSIQQLLRRRAPSNIRSFNSQSRRAQPHQPPKPRVLKPETKHPIVPPNHESGTSSKALPKAQPSTPPKPQAKLPARHHSSQFDDAFASRYGNAPAILLYVAPRHRAFQVLSYISGGIILYGAWNYAQVFLKDEPERDLYKPWYLKALGGVSVLFMTVFATTIILGPTKLIKSVSIVRAAEAAAAAATTTTTTTTTAAASAVQAPRVLRIEVKRHMPFTKPDIIRCPSSHIAVDKEVRSMQGAIPMHRVPYQDAQSFTDAYQAGRLLADAPPGGSGVLSALNRRMVNVWPAFKREVRRMCLRENMAYIEIRNNGTFKLDLGDCFILDDGKPLAQLMTLNPAARGSVWAYLGTLFRR